MLSLKETLGLHAYKLLTGLIAPPKEYAGTVSVISSAAKKALLSVDCGIAPNRDPLLPIMVNAHFGLGDKSEWGYLGSERRFTTNGSPERPLLSW